MTEYFMSKIPVKKIVQVFQERFDCPGYRDPVEVRPVSLKSMEHLGDLSNHILYIFANPPHDVKSGIFRVFLSPK
jgi:hypothetical protein